MPRYRLLLVDSNQDYRRVLRDYLARFDFEVLEAGAAIDALALARRERPDLIVVEAALGDPDGFSFVRALRSEPDVRGLPVLIVTAGPTPEERLSAVDSGVDDYLLKPFSMRELLFRVNRQIVHHRGNDPGEISGDLARFKLSDVLQILETNQATGVLEFYGTDVDGEIHLLDGYICGAFSGQFRGEEAVYRLIPLRRGRFRFSRMNIRSNIQTVRSTTEFMMEAFRRHDEGTREPANTDRTR